MTAEERLTLLDLAAAIQDAANEAEANATLRHMVETRRIRFDRLGLDWAA